MNRSFRPQIESLEERMVMDAAGTHVLFPALVAPVAADREPNVSNTNSYFTNDYSLTISDGISGSHLHKVGPGHLILPTANTYAGHELGDTLGYRHEHTRPSAAADDVWIDGNIITAESYDASANFLFGDGSVRFVSDGISSDPAAGFGDMLALDTDPAAIEDHTIRVETPR